MELTTHIVPYHLCSINLCPLSTLLALWIDNDSHSPPGLMLFHIKARPLRGRVQIPSSETNIT